MTEKQSIKHKTVLKPSASEMNWPTKYAVSKEYKLRGFHTSKQSIQESIK